VLERPAGNLKLIRRCGVPDGKTLMLQPAAAMAPAGQQSAAEVG
jgi:hypothetical protein